MVVSDSVGFYIGKAFSDGTNGCFYCDSGRRNSHNTRGNILLQKRKVETNSGVKYIFVQYFCIVFVESNEPIQKHNNMKTTIKVLGILSTALLFGLFAFKPPEEKKVVVIDAGHGGHDFGVTIYDIQEKAISEIIAKKIKALNKDSNINIVLLREGDHFMELSERVSIINNLKPDLLISLHVNSSTNAESNGADAFISSKKEFYEKSKENAEKIINGISGENLSKRKVAEAPFYILKNSNCPAITLEMGFLSNNKDRVYLTSESGQNEIAANILESIK